MSTGSMASSSKNMDNYSIDMCPICYDFNSELFYKLFTCGHIICRICLVKYLKNEINESRTDIGEYIAYTYIYLDCPIDYKVECFWFVFPEIEWVQGSLLQVSGSLVIFSACTWYAGVLYCIFKLPLCHTWQDRESLLTTRLWSMI